MQNYEIPVIIANSGLMKLYDKHRRDRWLTYFNE